METETLSNYEQPQEKHILSDMDINIPSHDDNSNSLHVNEINEADSDFCSGLVSSSNKTVNEENCDEIVSSSESKINGENNLEENVVKENENTLNRSINSPNVSSTNQDEESGKHSSSHSLDDETHVMLQEEDNRDCPLAENIDLLDKGKDNSNEVQNTSDDNMYSTKNEETVTASTNKQDNRSESEQKEEIHQNNINDFEKEDSNKETKEDKKDENNETEEFNKDLPSTNNELKNDETKNSLLKETLTRKRNEDEEKETTENENVDEMDMDDDFDPSLLCPDIAMEIDEAPVITTTDNVPVDGNKSPQLYEPVYSTYVDEMTGAEVTFNLTPEEHQLRQETYGEVNPVQFTKIHCTACNVHLGSALDGQGNRFVHPLLKVLICKDCYHFYTSGEFEKDEDGSELYCRWCGQGGQVMCCSACEMVFCKKCIRINFGRKKLIEIRDSDDWFCFRCNPSQLTALRVHCAEFMEYVRREISRAATLENATSFMTTDYTQCCIGQKKKSTEPQTGEPKKRRKKHVDPDYDPEMDKPSSPTLEVNTPARPVPILPKPLESSIGTGSAMKVPQGVTQGTVFRVGNTTFRPRTAFSQVRPIVPVSVVQAAVNATVVRPHSSTPGFIKIMPGGIRSASSVPRQPAQTFVSTSVRPQSFQPRQSFRMVNSSANAAMKHEWFEKTVRAAARVNSNLSYTLTQLNRAQATASSVEALAVVHNKLQEILSTSINSLIQIRKNLRAEFIAGIKNIRSPAAQPRPVPSTSAQDDDVIFVSPTTSPVPPPMTPTTSNTLPPSVTLTNSTNTPKRSTAPIVPTTSLQLIPSTNTISNGDKPKSFLRVKSLSALQNVTSECIMIPDDPVPPPPLVSITPGTSTEKTDSAPAEAVEKDVKDPAPTESSEKNVEEEPKNEEIEKEVHVENGDKDPLADVDNEPSESHADENEEDTSLATESIGRPESVNLNEFSKLSVHLVRSKEVDELIRKRIESVAGDTSE